MVVGCCVGLAAWAEGRVTAREESLDVPTVTWADPEAREPWRERGLGPIEAARRALLAHAAQLRLTPARIASALVTGVHDLHDGTAVIVTFEQRPDGRRVFRDELHVVMTARLSVVAITGALTPRLERRGEFSLTARSALSSAALALTLAPLDETSCTPLGLAEGGFTHWRLAKNPRPARTRPLYFPRPDGLVPAFYVELDLDQPTPRAFSFVVSAVDGEVLYRHDLTSQHAYSVWADPVSHVPWPGPRGPLSVPLESPTAPLPPLQLQQVVSLPHAGLSTGDPWLPAGAPDTRGNNVQAYCDLEWPNGFTAPGDELATATSPDTWAWAWNPALSPTQSLAQRSASVVQLFYVTNFLHDWFYDDGFDETARNGQVSNFGRGGAGNDPLLAESLDWSGSNNANITVPSDGSSPRMQMYRFYSYNGPTFDASLDTGVVAHEWGHLISERLVGDGNGLASLQGGALGEGWGDFHAALLLAAGDDVQVAPNAQWRGAYGLSSWAMEAHSTWGRWYGFRRYPLSADLALNPLSFRHISDGQPLPTTAPLSPAAQIPNAEVHNAGEVWAVMLWDCYVGLLTDPRFTFTQAQARMKRTLVAAYKATPLTPTFVEARDALLAVAAANDPQDLALFWTAFARRGLGSAAQAPARDAAHNLPLVEDFAVGGAVELAALALVEDSPSCDDDGTLDVGEQGHLQVRLRNVGTVPLVGATLTLSTGGSTLRFTAGSSRVLPDVAPLDTLDVSVPVALADDARGLQTMIVTASVQALHFSAHDVTTEFRGNFDVLPASSTNDDVEAPQTTWTAASDASLGPSAPFRRQRLTATQHVWFAPSPLGTADLWLVSAPLDVGPSGLRVGFEQRYDFDRAGPSQRDGAVVELSVDDGLTWVDVGSALTPGYPGTVDDDQGRSTNPLKGRPALVGQSPNYPGFSAASLDLAAWANQLVRLRFRVGGDDAVRWPARGWELDRFSFAGLRTTPFASLGVDPNTCVNHAPVASVGPDLEVDEGTRITLPGSAVDADGDAVTLTWTQSSGPLGVLVGSGFTAPEVMVDAPLTIALVASDGRAMSTPAVLHVMVRNVNRVPQVKAPPALAVQSGERVTVQATATDADAEPLVVAWKQTGGTPLVLDPADALALSFVVPEVGAVELVRLEVTARDAVSVSAPAVVVLTIRPAPQAAAPEPLPEPAQCGCAGAGGPWSLALLGLAALGRRRRRGDVG